MKALLGEWNGYVLLKSTSGITGSFYALGGPMDEAVIIVWPALWQFSHQEAGEKTGRMFVDDPFERGLSVSVENGDFCLFLNYTNRITLAV